MELNKENKNYFLNSIQCSLPSPANITRVRKNKLFYYYYFTIIIDLPSLTQLLFHFNKEIKNRKRRIM